MNKKILITALAVSVIFLGCKKPSDNDDSGDSVVQFLFDGQSFVLDGGPATISAGVITINAYSSDNRDTQLYFQIAGSHTGTYDIDSVGIQFGTGVDNYTATTSVVQYGAEVNLVLSEASPSGIKGTFTATVIKSFDPDFTAKDITSGEIDIKAKDIVSY